MGSERGGARVCGREPGLAERVAWGQQRERGADSIDEQEFVGIEQRVAQVDEGGGAGWIEETGVGVGEQERAP